MSTIVKNIHILKDGVWRPISKVFHQGEWKKMKGIFYDGVWYEIGSTCVVMPEGCAIATTEHPRWNENASFYGINALGFNLLPGCRRDAGNGYFYNIGQYSHHHTTSLGDPNPQDDYYVIVVSLYEHSGVVNFLSVGKKAGHCVRCVKDYDGVEPNGTILTNDYKDGGDNYYDSVVIGNQLWVTENLYTTKYQNGTDIPLITNNITWRGLTTGAYCWYDNNYTAYGQHYGALYNWYAVDNGLIDYNGYRVPSKEDWDELIEYLTTTNWCGDINVTQNNVAEYLKSCRQVNHPLADMHLHVETEEFIQEVIIYKNDVQVKTIGSSSTSALPIELGDIIKLQILTSRDYITIQDVTARISYGGIVNPGVRTFNMFEAPYHIVIR